ncbi:rRNA methyltransferase 1, mitochondrial [Salarias fasciatus]|uniref:rRNA methyltransferase 1, mitochondrial n=1 Tax=Salarias fasciatus TaxID=181472 RepID=A0A672H9B0_SALFA|nr:rRNA methyltransferase 1, mitochondrial [Salarias fasciatus]
MWLLGVAQHRFLLAVRRRAVLKPAGYHASAPLLIPEDGGPRRRSGARLKPGGRQEDPERSGGQSGAWRAGSSSRVSPELRRLSLEDAPAARSQRAAPSPGPERLEVVFGVAPCLLALSQGRRKARTLYVKDGEASRRPSVVRVCEEARGRGVPVQRVDRRELDRLSSGGVHQGVCLQASPLGFLTEDPAAAERQATPPLWLVLDRIQDPMNLGAILRSAYFLGVDRVASSVRSSCPPSPVVSKASSGVLEVFGVYGYQDLGELLRSKAARGWQVVGTVGPDGERTGIPVRRCRDFRMTKPTLLLLGGEGAGLSPELLASCHTLLTVPAGRDLIPGVDSLNVSVATGILLHSLLESRRSGGRPADR